MNDQTSTGKPSSSRAERLLQLHDMLDALPPPSGWIVDVFGSTVHAGLATTWVACLGALAAAILHGSFLVAIVVIPVGLSTLRQMARLASRQMQGELVRERILEEIRLLESGADGRNPGLGLLHE